MGKKKGSNRSRKDGKSKPNSTPCCDRVKVSRADHEISDVILPLVYETILFKIYIPGHYYIFILSLRNLLKNRSSSKRNIIDIV